MKHAIKLAIEKMSANLGGPFGALVTCGDTIVAEGWNQVTSSFDPTAHAEVVAIRNACRELGTFDLRGHQIYCSCEPCPMCFSAIFWARIDNIFYAAGSEDAANAGFDDSRIYDEINAPHVDRTIPMQQILRDEALRPFQLWLAKEDRISY
ncbi:MAG TPA: nucleoside deaminase [Pirellulaceae bacterium]|nr:nucleoside deaminase [Pirellulaceae bacterium]HMO90854.1 nucleoside deaminase [Pirellulaceae bacterium]HMP68670.1 nucleoside deaminase [Pirellulaceae bacterium]